jgi:hypothetical protein
MSKYLGMTDDEIVALKGAALKEVATELAIEGRSKMKADELRVAVHVAIMDLRKAIESTEPIATFVVPAVEESPELDTTGDADPFPAQLSMPEECAEAEESPELDTWHLQPNRKARREAARKQRKAAGRVAQKQNKLN